MIGHRMRRVTAVAFFSLWVTAYATLCEAQNGRQRQAAAEAYDRGTTAYVTQAYEEAARWFETANRLAPAAPALMQAIRAHERIANASRAATLALELQTTYADDSNAAAFAQGILDKYAALLVRTQVGCNADCKLELDGRLEDHRVFFVTPGEPHHLVAAFETGTRYTDIEDAAGETLEITFDAPKAAPLAPAPVASPAPPSSPSPTTPGPRLATDSTPHRKPLSPVFPLLGLGVTAVLGAGALVSWIDAKNKLDKFEDAARINNDCVSSITQAMCVTQHDAALEQLKRGEARDRRTNILIGATAVVAIGTGIVALTLTDWSGGRKTAHTATGPHPWFVGLGIAPRPGGAATIFEGRF